MASAKPSAVIIPFFLSLVFAFLSCSDKARQAAGAPEFGEIAVEGATLRTDPLVTASEIETIPKGTKVQILKKQADEVAIGSARDRWYFVKLESGMEGWIFGASLSMKERPKEDPSALSEKDVIEKVTGKWWQVNPDGSTGYLKVYFWPDGKYKHGWGAMALEEGKYTVLTSEQAIQLDKGSGAGDKLKLVTIGRELRLQGEKEGRKFTFRQGHTDPEAPEVSPEDTLKQKEKKEKAAGKPPS